MISRKIIGALAWIFPLFYFFLPIRMSIASLVLLFILIGFFIVFTKKRYFFEIWNEPASWLSILFFWILVGVLYSSAPWSWVSLNLSKYAKFLYAVALILLLISFPQWQKRSLVGFSLAMFLTLILTLINAWVGLPWDNRAQLGWGVFGDHITQNVMMSFFVIYCLTNISRPWINWSNFFWALSLTLSIISITHLSTGRTGLIVLFAGLIAWVVVNFGARKIWLGLPVLIFIAVGLMLSSNLMRDRFYLALDEVKKSDVDVASNIGHRLYNYKITPQLISEKPIFGHGTGAYHTEICRFIEKPLNCDTYSWHSHNQFLFFAADHGLIGVVIYLALILSLYKLVWKSKKPQAKVLLAALTSILIVDSLFNTPLFSSIESHFFVYMMALLVAMNSHSEDQIEVSVDERGC